MSEKNSTRVLDAMFESYRGCSEFADRGKVVSRLAKIVDDKLEWHERVCEFSLVFNRPHSMSMWTREQQVNGSFVDLFYLELRDGYNVHISWNRGGRIDAYPVGDQRRLFRRIGSTFGLPELFLKLLLPTVFFEPPSISELYNHNALEVSVDDRLVSITGVDRRGCKLELQTRKRDYAICKYSTRCGLSSHAFRVAVDKVQEVTGMLYCSDRPQQHEFEYSFSPEFKTKNAV